MGDGKPLIFIHGFCESHEIWTGFDERLADKFQVFVIDLPGFGNSKLLPVPFSIREVAVKVLDWMDQSEIDSPVVVGHSLGGYVALAMANLNPIKIGGLVLFHSTPHPDSEERKSNRSRVSDFVKKNGVAPFVDTYVPGLFFDKSHPAIHLVDKMARSTSMETLLAYTSAMRERPSSIDFLTNSDMPVLVLAGEMDSIIPVESALEFGRLPKKNAVCILKNTAHMGMYEKPQEAEAALAQFLLGI